MRDQVELKNELMQTSALTEQQKARFSNIRREDDLIEEMLHLKKEASTIAPIKAFLNASTGVLQCFFTGHKCD